VGRFDTIPVLKSAKAADAEPPSSSQKANGGGPEQKRQQSRVPAGFGFGSTRSRFFLDAPKQNGTPASAATPSSANTIEAGRPEPVGSKKPAASKPGGFGFGSTVDRFAPSKVEKARAQPVKPAKAMATIEEAPPSRLPGGKVKVTRGRPASGFGSTTKRF
jgi:hypothetical protein